MSDMSDMVDGSPVADRDAIGSSNETFRLDGNAAGGMLAEVFVPDMTSAQSICAQCGRTGPLGSLLECGPQMDTVLRCPTCDYVQMRIVHIPEREGQYCIDMQGMQLLLIAPSIPG